MTVAPLQLSVATYNIHKGFSVTPLFARRPTLPERPQCVYAHDMNALGSQLLRERLFRTTPPARG